MVNINGTVIERLVNDVNFKVLFHSTVSSVVKEQSEGLIKRIELLEKKIKKLSIHISELENNSSITNREMVY